MTTHPEPACRPTKRCTRCGETKPLDAFPLDKATPGGGEWVVGRGGVRRWVA